jgi:hypothetical protein
LLYRVIRYIEVRCREGGLYTQNFYYLKLVYWLPFMKIEKDHGNM